MTNFVLTGARGADHRYRTAASADRGEWPPHASATTIALLQRVRQPITRWSAAYDLRARKLHVVMGQKYGGRVLTFARMTEPSASSSCTVPCAAIDVEAVGHPRGPRRRTRTVRGSAMPTYRAAVVVEDPRPQRVAGAQAAAVAEPALAGSRRRLT